MVKLDEPPANQQTNTQENELHRAAQAMRLCLISDKCFHQRSFFNEYRCFPETCL
jgi:hypothetical protein